VDFPEPETPVTVMNFATGNSTSMFLRLCWLAPRTQKEPASSMRRSGTGIVRSRERNLPVTEPGFCSTSVAGPSATT
jgi:hypothetical protein